MSDDTLIAAERAQISSPEDTQPTPTLGRDDARADARLAWMQEIGTALGQHWKEDELLTFVMERVTWIMDAERATLFLLEPDGQHIWSRVVSDRETKEIRLRVGVGIAGWVAQHCKSINVKDAYKDSRFNPSFDLKTGFRTRSVLCQPMRNNKGVLIGVVQVLNKRSGYFTVEDEHLLSSISNTAAIVIENNRLYFSVVDRNLELLSTKRALEERVHELDTLYSLQRAIIEAHDLDDVLETVSRSAARLVPSNGCVITVARPHGYDSYCTAREGRDGWRFWRSTSADAAEGLSMQVMRSGEPYLCNLNCEIPPSSVYEEAGIDARSVLAVPLHADDGTSGAIKLFNRKGLDQQGMPRGFDKSDLKLLTLIAGQASTAIATSLARQKRETEDRLSAIGRMLSGIVHDLKTPLAIASGYVQLMARSDDPEKRGGYAASVKKQFEDLHRMTQEVLSYARGETKLFVRTVHMSVFVGEIEELLQQEFANTPVELSVSASYRGDVRMDEGKIKRALFNLARNAREAMPDGGTYTVEFTRVGDDLVIRSTDTGQGIPLDLQRRLFEAFVTRKSGGTGLGLAIVKRLVEEHGGSISFQSRIDEGTTFEIKLPIDQAERSYFGERP